LTTKNDVQHATNAANIMPTTLTALRSVRTTVPVVYDDVVGRLPLPLGTDRRVSTLGSWCCGDRGDVWNDARDSTSAVVDTADIGRSLSVSDGT